MYSVCQKKLIPLLVDYLCTEAPQLSVLDRPLLQSRKISFKGAWEHSMSSCMHKVFFSLSV